MNMGNGIAETNIRSAATKHKRTPGETGHASNRRRFARQDCQFPVEVYVNSAGHQAIWKATARNISNGGMRIECPTALSPMTPCHVAFSLPRWCKFKAPAAGPFLMVESQVRYYDSHHQAFGVSFLHPFQ